MGGLSGGALREVGRRVHAALQMTEVLMILLCGLFALGAAFVAGVRYREERHRRENQVIDVVLRGQERRLAKLEGLLKQSNEG